MKNATVTVNLTRRMLDALDALPEGYTVHPCNSTHPHPDGCDGWSPAEERSLYAAYRRLERARLRAFRLSR